MSKDLDWSLPKARPGLNLVRHWTKGQRGFTAPFIGATEGVGENARKVVALQVVMTHIGIRLMEPFRTRCA